MRREDAVFRRQERIVRPNRLCIDYIQSRGCQLAAVQRICNVLLHDQLSAGVVEENRAVLHFCDRFFIDKARVFGRQVAVERHPRSSSAPGQCSKTVGIYNPTVLLVIGKFPRFPV